MIDFLLTRFRTKYIEYKCGFWKMLSSKPSFYDFSDKMYLSENELLGSEESAIPVIKIHFLFVAFTVMRNPQFLGIRFETNVDEAQREDEGDGEGGYEYKETVMVVESGDFLKDELEVHRDWYKIEN